MDRIIRAGPHRVLNRAAYRKAGRAFWRDVGEYAHVIHFQASQWNTPDQASFTVNVSVTSAFFHEAWTGTLFPKNPASAAQLISLRLGYLTPANRDSWWTTASSEELSSTEIATALEVHALPFLAKLEPEGAVLEYLQSEERPAGVIQIPAVCRAIVLAGAGLREQATEQLQRAADGRGPGMDTARTIAQRLGLQLES